MSNGMIAAMTILVWSTSALAEGPAVREVCQAIHDHPVPRVSRLQATLQTLGLFLHPQKYGRPEVLQDPDSHGSTSSRKEGRSVIFSFAPARSSEEIRLMKEELKKIDEALKASDPDFGKMLAQKTIENCVKVAQELHFDLDRRTQLIQRKIDLADAAHEQESKGVDLIFRKKRSRLNRAWELVRVTNVDDVKRALTDPRVENVMIIGHSKSSTGQLEDSNQNAYPPSFFEDLPSNIRSISIYACNQEEIKKFYELAASFGSGSNRTLFMAKASEFLGQQNVAPLNGWRSFLKDVDRALDENWAPKMVPASLDCAMVIQGVKSTVGDFGIYLGRTYLGSLRESQASRRVEFKCSLLEGEAQIVLQSLSLRDVSNAAPLNPRIELTTPRGTASYPLKPLRRPDGTISTLKAYAPSF